MKNWHTREDIDRGKRERVQFMIFLFSLQKKNLRKFFFTLRAIPGGIAEGPPKKIIFRRFFQKTRQEEGFWKTDPFRGPPSDDQNLAFRAKRRERPFRRGSGGVQGT